MIVRTAQKADAPALLQLFAQLDDESKFMLFEPGERCTSQSEQEAIIESFAKSRNRCLLLAEERGLLGFCVLAGQSQRRTAHVASLVIGVVQAAWKRGIGSRLMAAAIAAAQERHIHRIELTVRKDNVSAIRLYQKFGFAVEGERRNALLIDGVYFDELFMSRVD